MIAQAREERNVLLRQAKEEVAEYKKDQKLECIVFAIDAERERISLKLSE